MLWRKSTQNQQVVSLQASLHGQYWWWSIWNRIICLSSVVKMPAPSCRDQRCLLWCFREQIDLFLWYFYKWDFFYSPHISKYQFLKLESSRNTKINRFKVFSFAFSWQGKVIFLLARSIKIPSKGNTICYYRIDELMCLSFSSFIACTNSVKQY